MPGPIAITRASPPAQTDMSAGETSASGSAMSISAGSSANMAHATGASTGSLLGASFGGGASFSRSNGGNGSMLSARLSTTPGGALGASFSGPGSASYREAIARSFGKDASDIMDYSISRFSSSHASTDSNMTALPSTSLPRNKLETTFCSNFKCCGIALENLHDLLQHYEEAHVKFEDDEVPSMVEDDNASAASSSATSSQPPSPKSAAAAAAAAASNSNGSGSTMPLAPSAQSSDDGGDHLSAFDTTVMRSPVKGKKRSFGQFSNPAAAGPNGGALHQSLRRALIDGGVGRSNSRASSVYSAGSPFSTPTASIPGTPVPGDVDTDTAFFGNGANPSAFSSLSIRANEDHDLPSCAPPNLFFPAVGTSGSTTMGSSAGASAAVFNKNKMGMGVNGLGVIPPAKREKTLSGNGSLESSISNANFYSDRPYKCTSPGCDKAYKQMNGLKYHRLHGQCNQNMMSAPQQVNNAVADKGVAGPNVLKSGSMPGTPSESEVGSGSSSSGSSPGSPQIVQPNAADASSTSLNSQAARDATKQQLGDKIYICQVGNCGKRYKNLNGLRYHYLHSGSHGMLGLQLLHSNGGGASARADATTGRPAVSTNDLSSEALKAVARAAAEQQALHQRNTMLKQQQQQQQQSQRDASSAGTESPDSQPQSASSSGPMPIPTSSATS